MEKIGFVYIMTNKNKTVLYIGVTNDLVRRVYEHKNHVLKNSFTDKYNIEYCIYYEEFVYFDLAIKREKELKKWNRQKKEDLINKKNPEWKEVVNEKGFLRSERGIPRYTRNDDAPFEEDGIPRYVWNDEAPFEEDGIPRCARNDEARYEQNGIPRYARNDGSPYEEDEIPRCARNDGSPYKNTGWSGGGFAAATPSPLLFANVCHSEQSEESK